MVHTGRSALPRPSSPLTLYEKTYYLTLLLPNPSCSWMVDPIQANNSFSENLELGLRDPSLLLIGPLCKENLNSGAVEGYFLLCGLWSKKKASKLFTRREGSR